ncbi:MAG: GrpE protein, partial [Acidimicrobiales bacterium]|nr:GrpE protein [Acidimicrobiales bacterium]
VTDAQERPEEERQSEAPPPGPAERVSELESQAAALEDRLRRTLADLDNLRKRVAREAGRERAEERARVASEWLPVIDHLEMALEHAQANPSAIVEGVRAVREQALAVLARLGFPQSDDVGEPFDPARHQAVSTVADSDKPAGTVVQVVRPRYGQGDQQLRPASVVVSTGSE